MIDRSRDSIQIRGSGGGGEGKILLSVTGPQYKIHNSI